MTADGWTPCVVALGTNQGDREETAFRALADLRAVEGFRITAQSSLHETVALTSEGFDPDAPGYINQIVLLDSAWSPEHTLARLWEVERAHGRVRTGERYADRTLDLDLIAYGELTMESETLTLPHPRAHERRFVVEPWHEVDPTATLPGQGPIAEILERIPRDSS